MSARETIAVAREPSASGYVGAGTHLFDRRLVSAIRARDVSRGWNGQRLAGITSRLRAALHWSF